MTDVTQESAPQHVGPEDGEHGGLPGPSSLQFMIAPGDHGQQWRVGARYPDSMTFIHIDKFDIESAARREKFVEALVERLQVPEHKVAQVRFALRAALDARAAEIVQELIAADEGDGPVISFAGAEAPCILNYTKSPDNKGPLFIGMGPQMIAEQLYGITDEFPKRIEGRLFAVGADHEVVELGSANKLFAWMRARAHVDWEKGASLTSQEQFYEHLAMTAEAYDAVEVLPHHPTVPGIYYAHPPIPAESDGLLDRLLAMFSPATEADRESIRAMILTLFWGGEPGSRPAFLVTGPDQDAGRGRGVGKSKLTDIIAGELAGGLLEVTPGDDIAGVKTRLLSPAAARLRAIRLDNIKNRKLSWSDLEALITTPVISGKALYRGEGHRPNTLTWLLTLNDAGLSKDLAQRVIPIKLARPQFDAGWEKQVRRFIRDGRWNLIGEITALLRSEGAEMRPRTRWAAWEEGVLGKTGRVCECQGLILERQGAMDVDEEEAEAVIDYMAARLRHNGHDPEAERIRIRGPVVCEWLKEVTGERLSQVTYKRRLNALHLERLEEYKNDRFKGYLWTGAKAGPHAPITDLRVADHEKPLDPEMLTLHGAYG